MESTIESHLLTNTNGRSYLWNSGFKLQEKFDVNDERHLPVNVISMISF